MPKREVPEETHLFKERVERERERLQQDYAGKRFVVSFSDYLMDPEPRYYVAEHNQYTDERYRSTTVHVRGLSEEDARTRAAQFEAEYPDGTPPDFWWNRLPEANKHALAEIMAQAIRRLVDMKLEVAEKRRRGTLTEREAELVSLLDRDRAGLSGAEDKRLSELCSTWPWPFEEKVAPKPRAKRSRSSVDKGRRGLW